MLGPQGRWYRWGREDGEGKGFLSCGIRVEKDPAICISGWGGPFQVEGAASLRDLRPERVCCVN